MERFQQIYEAGLEILCSQYVQNMAAIKKEVQADIDSLDKEFLDVCDGLLQKCISQQEDFQKEPVKYVDISLLASSKITGSYDFGIFLYSAYCYLDPEDTSAFWHPHFIYRHLDGDRALFSKQIRQKLVRVRDHEIEEFMQRYAMAYDTIAIAYFLHAAPLITRLDRFAALSKTDDCQIRIGKYMENMKVIA